MLPDLYFRITAQGNTAAAFGKVRSEISGIKREISGLSAAATGLFRSFIGFTAVGGVLALGRSIRETVRDAGDLVDAANKIGVTTGALQELRFAAEQSGESISDLDSMMAMFTKRIGDASQGSGELYDLLNLNGVALRNQNGEMRSVSDILADVADLIANATSAQDKMNVAIAAFGRGGAGAVNVFANGAAGIRAFAAEAREAGIVLDEGMLRKAAEIDDEWQKLTARLGTLWKSMILGVVGEVDNVVAAIGRVGEQAAFTQAETAASLRDYANLAGIPEYLRKAAAEAADRIEAGLEFRGPGSGRAAERDSMLALDRYLAERAITPTVVPPSGGSSDKETDLTGSADLTREAIERLDDSLRDTLETGRDFAETIINGLMDGKSAAESLSAALKQLASHFLNSGLDMLFGTGKAGGGLFSLLGGLGGSPTVPFSTPMFAEGGYLKPGQFGIAGEAGPELLYGGRSGITVTPSGRAPAPSVNVNVINNAGVKVETRRNDRGGLDIVLDAVDEQLPAMIRKHRSARRI